MTTIADETGVREAFPNMTDDDLRAEIKTLRADLDDLRKHHMGKTKEDAHRKIDEHATMKRAAWQAALRDVRYRATRPGGDLGGFSLPFEAYPWTQPAVVKALHAAIDSDPLPGDVAVPFSAMSAGAVRQALDRTKAAIADREDELAIRDANREVARVQAKTQAARERRENDRKAAA